jgi:hypothetical protein
VSDRALTAAVSFLLLAVAALVYLEWWRADELESLHGRVNELELARQRRARRTPAAQEGAT